MTQEEIINELLAKLPAEIVEKIKAETITEDEVKEYIQPLAEQYKDKIEGFAQLSDEQLEAVNGGASFDEKAKCFFHSIFTTGSLAIYEACKKKYDNPEDFLKAAWR